MHTPRKLKKSEFLEVRLPHPTKQAFMARCRQDGCSASDAVRAFIDGYLTDRPSRTSKLRRSLHLIVGAIAAAALGAVAAPSLALPSLSAPHVTDAAVGQDFRRIDVNHDGKISFQEFRRYRGR